jgi:hypothetical protein
LKDNFITAYFCDDDRKFIEILTTSEDKKETYPTVIPFDENEPQYKILLEFVTLDDLHENTYQLKKTEREMYEKELIEIAKKEGMVLESSIIDTKFFNLLSKALFNFDPEKNSDQLFALKISLFEVDKIKDAPNDDKKTKLRKSKTLIEALQAAFEIYNT